MSLSTAGSLGKTISRKRVILLYDLNDDGAGAALSGRQFDVCVAGAGVAGITIALRLARKGKSVLLLEGGGDEPSSESQDVYAGQNVGHDYFDLRACRLRYLGGTSNHWNGLCRPLDASDFNKKAYIPYSGWPISKKDLLPYESETYEILDIPERPFKDRDMPASGGMLRRVSFLRSAPTRFREKYGADLKAAANIHLVLNANVVDLRLDEMGDRVSHVVCRSHADPQTDRILRAGTFVVAMGGIENARILLSANSQIPDGLGNQKGFVGRFFAEHPHSTIGMFWQCDATGQRSFYTTNPVFEQRELIPACSLKLLPYKNWPIDPTYTAEEAEEAEARVCDFEEAQRFLENLGNYLPFDGFGLLRSTSEQVPNPDSRVSLSNSRDKFGMRTTILDWRMTPQDYKSIRVCALEFAKVFALADLGRVKLQDWILNETLPPNLGDKPGGRHHMGTTRMSDDPSTGVVDNHCRVFGTENLYIAGSSVFSTSGYANPTFTIVQLALRLGDHLTS